MLFQKLKGFLMKKENEILIPSSSGELIDKITILKIKKKKF